MRNWKKRKIKIENLITIDKSIVDRFCYIIDLLKDVYTYLYFESNYIFTVISKKNTF